jgi:hypothetical protein
MIESVERTVKLGFRASPKKVFDKIEAISAEMLREGWNLRDTLVEDGLGCIHLFFERELREDIRSEE